MTQPTTDPTQIEDAYLATNDDETDVVVDGRTFQIRVFGYETTRVRLMVATDAATGEEVHCFYHHENGWIEFPPD